MPYQYLTFADARTILAQRLQDPNLTYWSQPRELDDCIAESLRFHNALTGSYKQKISFATAQDQNYYDLPTVAPAVCGYNVTDVQIINQVLAALLEPPLNVPVSSWSGTGQFSLSQLQSSLWQRVNQFLGDTGVRVTQASVAGPSSPIDLVSLPDSTLDVRRVGWIAQPPVPPPATPTYPLGRIDEWAAQAYSPEATQNPAIPLCYSVFVASPLSLRLVPPPLALGAIDLLLVTGVPQPQLNLADPVAIPLPCDLTPAIKYGVLADLLGTDGPSRDYARASYCEQRYAEFVQLASIYPSILTSDVNNITIGVGSVNDLDCYLPDWQQTTGQPQFIGMAGRNLLCVGPTPDTPIAGNYGIGAWVVANAFVGTANQYLQVARDQIDPVLDYAQHAASLKMAGAEFDGTTRLFENMINAAKRQNGRLSAVSFYRTQLEQPAHKDEMDLPRMEMSNVVPANTR